MIETIQFTPIGFVRSRFKERAEAPRQATSAPGEEGQIVLSPGNNYEDALSDLSGWERIWVLFVFDRNSNWRPKVLPPRSTGTRRGVFSTRSPHRPNPIGMSVVRLLRVESLTLHVEDLDILDGSPVLDIKPYVPYADAFPASRSGWLDDQAPPAEGALGEQPADPISPYTIHWSEAAERECGWLLAAHGIDLREAVDRTLKLGPQPHAYRRIRREGDRFVLAQKEWRIRFSLAGTEVTVEHIFTGYRPRDLAVGSAPTLDVHREFTSRFGA